MAEEFKPNQEGDFIKDSAGKNIQYKGPIWDVTYPAKADSTRELWSWIELGYETLLGYSYDLSEEFTIRVMGDIPEFARENMKKVGIECTLTKERGPVIDLEETAEAGV